MEHSNDDPKQNVGEEPSIRSVLVGFLLSLIFTLVVILYSARPLRCLLEYYMTEAKAALILGFAGGIGAILTQLLPTKAKKISLSILGGVVVALFGCLVVSVSLTPPSRGECFPTPTIAVTLTSTYTLPKPTPSPPQNTRPAPTPTDTPIPTISPTPTSTLRSPVTLIGPEDDSCLDCGSEVLLRWNWPHLLQENEYYVVNVLQAQAQNPRLYQTTEDHFYLGGLSLGEHKWAVTVMRSIQGKSEPVSEESEWRHFHILPPAPVVQGISPTSTLEGAGGTVVISGENFTYPLTLTIGISLQAAIVNSSTITATIPLTLEVGEYPVIVTDSNGKGVSPVSFTVKEPPTPTPTRPPKTPTPMTPVYPPPVLGWGGIIGCNVTFKWEWPGTLAEDEWFAVRVEKVPNEPHSRVWVKEREYIYSLDGEGDYVWEVAICRGDPAAGHCSKKDGTELVVSTQSIFSFGGCSPPPPPPTECSCPPCC